MSRFSLTGATVHAESGCVRGGAIVIADGRIHDIKRRGAGAERDLPLRSGWHVVPGFIDTHIHGAAGVDVMDASHHALDTLSRYLPSEGTTGFLATTMSAGAERLADVLAAVGAYASPPGRAELLGVHLEGPFLAAGKAGAQGARWLTPPDNECYARWQAAARGKIRIVTLAPELPGAASLIQRLQDDGVQASIGHTACSAETAADAAQRGCRRATHLFNAMSGLHQREPGAACAVLLADEVQAEIIADGVHVAPAMLRLAYRAKGAGGLMLVTDSMRAKGMDDGTYELGDEPVHVAAGIARRPGGALAGSVLRMDQGVRNLLRFLDCSLPDAVRMACANPAQNVGVIDRKGTLAPGKDADLVVLDEQLNVRLTLCRGKAAFEAPAPHA